VLQHPFNCQVLFKMSAKEQKQKTSIDSCVSNKLC